MQVFFASTISALRISGSWSEGKKMFVSMSAQAACCIHSLAIAPRLPNSDVDEDAFGMNINIHMLELRSPSEHPTPAGFVHRRLLGCKRTILAPSPGVGLLRQSKQAELPCRLIRRHLRILEPRPPSHVERTSHNGCVQGGASRRWEPQHMLSCGRHPTLSIEPCRPTQGHQRPDWSP